MQSYFSEAVYLSVFTARAWRWPTDLGISRGLWISASCKVRSDFTVSHSLFKYVGCISEISSKVNAGPYSLLILFPSCKGLLGDLSGFLESIHSLFQLKFGIGTFFLNIFLQGLWVTLPSVLQGLGPIPSDSQSPVTSWFNQGPENSVLPRSWSAGGLYSHPSDAQ